MELLKPIIISSLLENILHSSTMPRILTRRILKLPLLVFMLQLLSTTSTVKVLRLLFTFPQTHRSGISAEIQQLIHGSTALAEVAHSIFTPLFKANIEY
jgi:hypothetical protein